MKNPRLRIKYIGSHFTVSLLTARIASSNADDAHVPIVPLDIINESMCPVVGQQGEVH